MVITFNRKMMSPNVPVGPGSPEAPTYEKVEIELGLIGEFPAGMTDFTESDTLNLINFLSDHNGVTKTSCYRISEKESKGAENLMNGKPRHYPAAYVEGTKEQIDDPINSLPDE